MIISRDGSITTFKPRKGFDYNVSLRASVEDIDCSSDYIDNASTVIFIDGNTHEMLCIKGSFKIGQLN